MENVDRLSSYRVLLKIRQKVYFRDMLIAGGLFLFAILSTTGMLLLTEWNGRGVYLMAMFDILLAVGFLTSWARHEIVKRTVELMNNLQIRE
jgi:hypothetical protein